MSKKQAREIEHLTEVVDGLIEVLEVAQKGIELMLREIALQERVIHSYNELTDIQVETSEIEEEAQLLADLLDQGAPFEEEPE